MTIRHFQPGDEYAQLTIYNSAGSGLAKFKPASIVDLQRRTQAKDFEPTTRFYVEDAGKVVAYCSYQPNGRISYPWCLPGHEAAAEPLFAHTLTAMHQRGLRKAFAAYRHDWPTISAFFQQHQFVPAREMVNFVLAFENMPTASARVNSLIGPVTGADIPGIFALDPTLFRVKTAAALEDAWWHNPGFKPEALFVLRQRQEGAPLAAGLFITDPLYADPRAVDADMPCFRLGAFGTEGMTTKRIKGLFSFVAAADRRLFTVGMDMLSYATSHLLQDEDDIWCCAAQVASDAPALLSFYERNFERQGSFPVFERDLT